MNKTVKTILQIAGYIISVLLGAYGGSAMMLNQQRTYADKHGLKILLQKKKSEEVCCRPLQKTLYYGKHTL